MPTWEITEVTGFRVMNPFFFVFLYFRFIVSTVCGYCTCSLHIGMMFSCHYTYIYIHIRCTKLHYIKHFQFLNLYFLLSSYTEIYIHGLGAAINRAINLALQLQQKGHGSIEVYQFYLPILVQFSLSSKFRVNSCPCLQFIQSG